jgi:peptidoglycan/LPS O-acetylase OafA/YrhL
MAGGARPELTARSETWRTIESISYPQYLVIFPMFLFCGVYFPLSQLPDWGQAIAAKPTAAAPRTPPRAVPVSNERIFHSIIISATL